MGLEAQCLCRWSGGSGAVKAVLEARDLILRGAVKRSVAVAELTALRIEADALSFAVAGETITLELGAERAGRWLKKLTTPPPSLAAKLGIGPDAKALVIGTVADSALRAALDGAVAADRSEARLSLAVIEDEAGLDAALSRHDDLPPGTPIWIVHGKGKQAEFGGDAVRRKMRAIGYADTKIAAVSETLSATRNTRR